MVPKKYETESSNSSAKNRAHEAPAAFSLPEFDSLPATAGLTNIQAFHLGIRHSLALLPALFAKGMDERLPDDYPGRFSMRN